MSGLRMALDAVERWMEQTFQARCWSRAWKQLAWLMWGDVSERDDWLEVKSARIAELEDALRLVRDYAGPGPYSKASAELTLDDVFKAADDALEKPNE